MRLGARNPSAEQTAASFKWSPLTLGIEERSCERSFDEDYAVELLPLGFVHGHEQTSFWILIGGNQPLVFEGLRNKRCRHAVVPLLQPEVREPRSEGVACMEQADHPCFTKELS